MTDRGTHSIECAKADGGDCHCDCHGTMHGILHMPGRGHKVPGATHGQRVSIVPVRGAGGKVAHYRVANTATGLPPGGGTKTERQAARAAEVTVTGSRAHAADFHRWQQDSKLPGRELVYGPTPREKRIAQLREEFKQAKAAHEANVAEVTADMKRRRVPVSKRPGMLRERTMQTESDMNWAQSQLDYLPTMQVNDPTYDKPTHVGYRQGQSLNRERPLAVYGDMLHMHDQSESTHQNMTELEMAPVAVHAVVADHLVGSPKGGIFVGDSYIPDLDSLGYLRDEQPRGWTPGSTFAQVAGVYSPSDRVVAIGKHRHHGSHSVALHEFGHGADDALGKALGPGGHASDFPAFVAVHNQLRELGDAEPYFLQAGDAGRSEAWAEAFAAWNQARASGGDPGLTIAKALGTVAGSIGDAFAGYFDGILAQLEARNGGK